MEKIKDQFIDESSLLDSVIEYAEQVKNLYGDFTKLGGVVYSAHPLYQPIRIRRKV
ncbi:hypothetical protein [Clostridium tunisiense]|uniref:hypothetical protein n=1 Tax=Clostridium tunisiense TaxID=219748 RepID=UPI00031B483E|nr:hypothetical protein [Clostridium tunisiense]